MNKRNGKIFSLFSGLSLRLDFKVLITPFQGKCKNTKMFLLLSVSLLCLVRPAGKNLSILFCYVCVQNELINLQNILHPVSSGSLHWCTDSRL